LMVILGFPLFIIVTGCGTSYIIDDFISNVKTPIVPLLIIT